LIQSVVNAVAIAVQRAALRIDTGTLGRVRATIEPVVDPVTIGVQGAAIGIHPRAGRRIRATVAVIGDPVAVAVGGRDGHDVAAFGRGVLRRVHVAIVPALLVSTAGHLA
jgi:hypothetical protein